MDRLKKSRRNKDTTDLGLNDILISVVAKEIKSVRQTAMTRVTSIFAYYIERDLSSFADRFVSICDGQL